MNSLNFVLGTFIAWLGLFGGLGLALIAPEELNAGKRHFALLLRLALAMSIVIALSSVVPMYISAVALALAFMDGKRLYIFSGIPLFLAWNHVELFAIAASGLFLGGLALGSLEAASYLKGEKLIGLTSLIRTTVMRYIWFLPLSLLPFALSKL